MRALEEVLAPEDDTAERGLGGERPDMGGAVGTGAANDGQNARMDAAGGLRRGEFVEISVEGGEEALADVSVGLAEIDVEDVWRHVAGDGEQGGFDAFDRDAGKAVEDNADGRGVCASEFAPGAGSLSEPVRNGLEKGLLNCDFAARGRIGA